MMVWLLALSAICILIFGAIIIFNNKEIDLLRSHVLRIGSNQHDRLCRLELFILKLEQEKNININLQKMDEPKKDRLHDGFVCGVDVEQGIKSMMENKNE